MERRQYLQSTVLSAAATMLGIAPLAAATTHLSFLQESVMSDPTRPYEPLTSENAVLNRADRSGDACSAVDLPKDAQLVLRRECAASGTVQKFRRRSSRR